MRVILAIASFVTVAAALPALQQPPSNDNNPWKCVDGDEVRFFHIPQLISFSLGSANWLLKSSPTLTLSRQQRADIYFCNFF